MCCFFFFVCDWSSDVLHCCVFILRIKPGLSSVYVSALTRAILEAWSYFQTRVLAQSWDLSLCSTGWITAFSVFFSQSQTRVQKYFFFFSFQDGMKTNTEKFPYQNRIVVFLTAIHMCWMMPDECLLFEKQVLHGQVCLAQDKCVFAFMQITKKQCAKRLRRTWRFQGKYFCSFCSSTSDKLLDFCDFIIKAITQ